MRYDRAGMKLDVRQAIRETRPRPMWITLLYMAVVGVGSSVIEWAVGLLAGKSGGLTLTADLFGWGAEAAVEELLSRLSGGDVLRLVLVGFIGALLSSLWAGLMRAGYEDYCLAVERRERPGLEGLFRLFGSFAQVKTVVLAWLLVFIRVALWALLLGAGMGLGFVAGAALAMVSEWLAGLWMLAVLAAFVVGIIWVSLRYAFVNFVILDDPGVTARQAVRRNKQLIRGRVWGLFVLHLSFIGWYLLLMIPVLIVAMAGAALMAGQIISGGGNVLVMGGAALLMGGGIFLVMLLGSLFLTPYITACTARFYDLARGWVPGQPPLLEEPAIPEPGMADGPGGGDTAETADGPGNPADPDAPQRPPYE